MGRDDIIRRRLIGRLTLGRPDQPPSLSRPCLDPHAKGMFRGGRLFSGDDITRGRADTRGGGSFDM
jgi:hypothetical protein